MNNSGTGSKVVLVTDGFFDGSALHDDGPYSIVIERGIITAIESGDIRAIMPDAANLCAPFILPGLVEGHGHVFLDGAELDPAVRKTHLGATIETMLAVARRNIALHTAAGVTLVRDAGDLHGVNALLQAELSATPGASTRLRIPGTAIRKKGRYGGFMAVEVTDAASIVKTIHGLVPAAQDLKILLTGIIDFEKGEVRGDPQFDLDECRLIVKTARELGLPTFAHCSGLQGLKLAAEAGIDSIEHGFFMTRDILKKMADKGIAWVPTVSPVYFQYAHPEPAGWNSASVAGLKGILDNHFEHINMAVELGVPVVAGSDAGSIGVPHGSGLVDELFFLRRAGMSTARVLASATSLPRRLWHCKSADIEAGSRANIVMLEGSPFEDFENVRRVRGLLAGAGESRDAARSLPHEARESVSSACW